MESLEITQVIEKYIISKHDIDLDVIKSSENSKSRFWVEIE
jgi:hypothetical protein